MRKILVFLMLLILITSGCAGKKKPLITTGLPQEQVKELWGEPSYKIPLGMTEKKYPVEIWEYQQSRSLFRKAITHTLIFVDNELYGFAVNDPDTILKLLDKLGVIPENTPDLATRNYQQWLNSIAVEAQKTRQTMDIINSYKNQQTIQMQIQHQQQMRILQQQKMPILPPPSLPPQPVRQNQ